MSYEVLKLIIVVLGPVIIYTTTFSVVRIPDQIAGMPAIARHTIEAVGAMLIGVAWLYIGLLGGPIALLGLLLLLTPTVAHYVSRFA